ncbi:MAG: type II toxin-antitoxin system VapC family toxin [Herminiimonas sp.]|nr:type II toxin-antitoxin system VapC family toxin [Herminiimonas sp.]
MIGLDTNVLVRYISQDDLKQSARATKLIESLTKDVPGFITLIALIELVWVMQSCYAAAKPEVIAILEMLVRTQEFRIENVATVIQAINVYTESKADFSDCLIERSANAAGCDYTVSFDENAIRSVRMRAI